MFDPHEDFTDQFFFGSDNGDPTRHRSIGSGRWHGSFRGREVHHRQRSTAHGRIDSLRPKLVDAGELSLLEEPTGSFEVSDGIVALTLRPFELMTVRFTR